LISWAKQDGLDDNETTVKKVLSRQTADGGQTWGSTEVLSVEPKTEKNTLLTLLGDGADRYICGIQTESPYGISVSPPWDYDILYSVKDGDVQSTGVDVSLLVSPTSASVALNAVFPLTLKVTNRGSSAVTSVTVENMLPVELQLQSFEAVGASVEQNGSEITFRYPQIDAGGIKTIVLMLKGIEPGTATNTATVTLPGGDTDPSNNTAESVVTVRELKTGPDLKGTWNENENALKVKTKKKKKGRKNGPHEVSIEFVLKGKFKVLNIGEELAGPSVVRFYLSDDAAYDANDAFLIEKHYGAVPSGHSKKVNFNVTISQYPLGKYVIGVVDAAKAVEETNEDNNEAGFGPLQ
jgi:uncharacterized repeat protein (TIGR01451 family)